MAGRIRERGHEVLFLDVGTGGAPGVKPDVSRFEIAEAADIALKPLLERRDRGECVAAMSKAASSYCSTPSGEMVVRDDPMARMPSAASSGSRLVGSTMSAPNRS